MNSGNINTTAINDLLFGAGASVGAVEAGGSGFTVRSLEQGNIIEEKIAGAPGSYNATATHGGGSWVMQVVAFKPLVDTVAPSVPTQVSATATSSTAVDLTWQASTDAVGVAGYRLFRNGAEIATTTGTNYQNTELTPGTTYSYGKLMLSVIF